MINVNLENTTLYKILQNRSSKDNFASVLTGLTVTMSGDASSFLGFIKSKCPGYTSHDIQHSFRIINKIGQILSEKALEELSSVEIYSLIIAAAFHDVGMVKDRDNHAELSAIIFDKYIAEKSLVISEYALRLNLCIGFIMKSHAMTWELMASSNRFQRDEKIADQKLRTKILCILLRLGDLLDLDSERSCDALYKLSNELEVKPVTKVHHDRHNHVIHYCYDNKEISCNVEPHSKEEHDIWLDWFGFIEQEIMHANTYIFRDSLKDFMLPTPKLEICKADFANYEIWPLRFEVDERGRIWEIISQSIYTGKFDFVRELIQNAIDAELFWIFLNNATLSASTRDWRMDGYRPYVLLSYSESRSFLKIIDNGIGMDKDSLQNFLFKVSASGYKDNFVDRVGVFPSIAKFGIGFVSILVRATKILINTKKRGSSKSEGRNVFIKSESLNAYTEISSSNYGTSITLELNDKFSSYEVFNYLRDNFSYTSIPIILLNYDLIEEIVLSSNLGSLPGVINSKLVDYVLNNGETNLDSYKFEDIRDDIKKIQLVSGNSASCFVCIESKSIESENIQEPIIFCLNSDFGIDDVVVSRDDVDRVDFFVIFVPVNYVNYEDGVEWHSMHGFIVNEKMVYSQIFRVAMVGQFGNAKLLGFDEYEEYIEKRDLYLARNSMEFDGYGFHEDIEVDGEDENSFETSTLMCEPENIVFTKPEYKDRVEFFTNDCACLHEVRTSDDVIRRDDINNKINYFLNCFKKMDGSVYQDGIRLPVTTSSIVPFGAARAKVNFTGLSRFELNVSRNAVNESPVLLKLWEDEVGSKIQNHVLQTISSTFELYGIEMFKQKDVLLSKGKTDFLSEYTLKGIQQLLFGK